MKRPKGPSTESDHGGVCRIGCCEGSDGVLREGRGGEVLAHGKVGSDPEAIFEVLREHCLYPRRIVMERGDLVGLVGAGASPPWPAG